MPCLYGHDITHCHVTRHGFIINVIGSAIQGASQTNQDPKNNSGNSDGDTVTEDATNAVVASEAATAFNPQGMRMEVQFRPTCSAFENTAQMPQTIYT